MVWVHGFVHIIISYVSLHSHYVITVVGIVVQDQIGSTMEVPWYKVVCDLESPLSS